MNSRIPREATLAVMAALVAAACGSDSTAPTGANVALHFDSLYVQMEHGDLSETAKFARGFSLSALELPTAYGAHPTAVDVHTAVGIERWHGLEYTEPMPNSLPSTERRSSASPPLSHPHHSHHPPEHLP